MRMSAMLFVVNQPFTTLPSVWTCAEVLGMTLKHHPFLSIRHTIRTRCTHCMSSSHSDGTLMDGGTAVL